MVDLANGALPDIFALLRDYDAFSTDNDPYGEHDFGAFSFGGAKLFLKIDYTRAVIFDSSGSHWVPLESIQRTLCLAVSVCDAERI